MSPNPNGLLVVVSGPSGVGKTTIVRRACERDASLLLSVSATTRSPRPGEEDGTFYRFLAAGEFEALRDGGGLLEWAEVHGALYGTPAEPVHRALAEGRTVVLEIDVQGARQVRRALPASRLVFVEPPSWDELEARLAGRATESGEVLSRRLLGAIREFAVVDEFDYRLVNEDLEEAVDELLRIIEAEREEERA